MKCQLLLPGCSFHPSELYCDISNRQLSRTKRIGVHKFVCRSGFASVPRPTQGDVTAVVLSTKLKVCKTHLGGCREGVFVVSESGAAGHPGKVTPGDVVVHAQTISANRSILHLNCAQYGSVLAKKNALTPLSKGVVLGKLSGLLEHNLKSLLTTHSPPFELACGASDGLIWLKAQDARKTIDLAMQLSNSGNRALKRPVSMI